MMSIQAEAGPSTAPPQPQTSELDIDDLIISDVNDNNADKGKAKTNTKTTSKTKTKPPAKAKTQAQARAQGRSKPIPKPIEAFEDPGVGEEETVHEVYERIAPHFSQTRYKPWPLITKFLTSLPRGSIGLDSGAGNGKYIPAAADAGHSMIALDRSLGLLEIAQKQRGGGDVVRGDLGARCWRSGVYDFVISVAAIHHLSTPERRRQAVQALLPCLRLSEAAPYARFFIYVWAYEQGSASKRAMGSAANIPNPDSPNPPSSASAPSQSPTPVPDPASASASTFDPTPAPAPAPAPRPDTETEVQEGPEVKIQDVLVPWVLKGKAGEEDVVHHRYYHLFVKGELKEMVLRAARVEEYRTPTSPGPGPGPGSKDKGRETIQEEEQGPWLRIKGEGWEADNWWIEAEVGKGPYRPDPTSTSTPDSES